MATTPSGCAISRSSFRVFAGIGGGLTAINFEIITAVDSVSVIRSGAICCLPSWGPRSSSGPSSARCCWCLASVLLSELSKAWLLYLGLVFLFMVMFAPGGVASLIMMNLRLAKFGKLRALLPSYLALFGTGAGRCAGRLHGRDDLPPAAQRSPGARVDLPGRHAQRQGFSSWFGAGFVLLTGLGLFELCRRQFRHQWDTSRKKLNTRSRGRRCNHGAKRYLCIGLRNLRKSFGKTEIIRGAELAVQAGERVAIIGPNGAGKSTLFNLISGRFAPTSGGGAAQRAAHRWQSPSRSTAWGSREASRSPISSQPQRVREPALRCALEPGLQIQFPALSLAAGRRQ